MNHKEVMRANYYEISLKSSEKHPEYGEEKSWSSKKIYIYWNVEENIKEKKEKKIAKVMRKLKKTKITRE